MKIRILFRTVVILLLCLVTFGISKTHASPTIYLMEDTFNASYDVRALYEGVEVGNWAQSYYGSGSFNLYNGFSHPYAPHFIYTYTSFATSFFYGSVDQAYYSDSRYWASVTSLVRTMEFNVQGSDAEIILDMDFMGSRLGWTLYDETTATTIYDVNLAAIWLHYHRSFTLLDNHTYRVTGTAWSNWVGGDHYGYFTSSFGSNDIIIRTAEPTTMLLLGLGLVGLAGFRRRVRS